MGNKRMANHPDNLDALVRESLRQKILTGVMEGGFHLSELKISKDYNVSRTPVREALCALAADGLVEMVPHRGAFVTQQSKQSQADQLRAYTLFTGLAAKLAAENASIEMLMDLETAFSFTQSNQPMSADVFQNAAQTAVEMVEKAAGSNMVSEAISMVSRRLALSDVWATVTTQEQQKEMTNQFGLLMAAIKRKKGDAAEKTMRQITVMVADAFMATQKSASVQEDVAIAMLKQTKESRTTAH
ncbi:MAG: hypothetical protein COY40_05560 [Alphaproteobacteria bacterium CG_4_10_14_0_8_um_filter_53_9]|nr:MAG: hypothetical protein COY40_05560 [Alphaproteobacteria bacterium CG_4_10_14_0_8_um_filter_53_9]